MPILAILQPTLCSIQIKNKNMKKQEKTWFKKYMKFTCLEFISEHFRRFMGGYSDLYLSIYYNALVFLIRWNKVFCIGWVIHASVNGTRKTMSDLRGVAHICMYVCNGPFSFLKIMTWLESFCLLVACTMIQFRSMWRSCRRTTTVSVCACACIQV